MLSIGYLHTFQPRQWTAPVTTGQFVYPVTPWTANVVIREVNPITPAGIHLTNGNAMLGLYAAVTHISLGRFVPTVAELIWHRRAAGRIYIDTKQGSTTLDSANNSTNGFSLHVPESNSSNAGYAGQVIDPIDHTLVVSYKFYGRRIGSKDMYTSIMESLIIMTYNGRSEPFESLTATSVSGNCALHIDAFRSERPDVNNISRLVFFLALITTNHKRFDEMEFSLEKGPPGGRRRVAEGYLFRVDAGVATA